MRGTREAASASACALAPARGGSMTTPSKAFSSAGRERECEEVAPLGLDPLQSLRATQGGVQRVERRLARFHRPNRRPLRQRQRESADAGEEVDDAPASGEVFSDQPGHDLLGFGGGLDEGARRRCDECPGNLHDRLRK